MSVICRGRLIIELCSQSICVAEKLKLHLRRATREERATAETIVIICNVIYNKYAKKKNNSFVASGEICTSMRNNEGVDHLFHTPY